MPKSLWEAGLAGDLEASKYAGGAIRFRNPSNGYIEIVDKPGLWCLLFGCIYLAYKGAWMAAVLAFALVFVTGGLSWLVFPFFARRLVAKSYLQRGWQFIGVSTVEITT